MYSRSAFSCARFCQRNRVMLNITVLKVTVQIQLQFSRNANQAFESCIEPTDEYDVVCDPEHSDTPGRVVPISCRAERGSCKRTSIPGSCHGGLTAPSWLLRGYCQGMSNIAACLLPSARAILAWPCWIRQAHAPRGRRVSRASCKQKMVPGRSTFQVPGCRDSLLLDTGELLSSYGKCQKPEFLTKNLNLHIGHVLLRCCCFLVVCPS